MSKKQGADLVDPFAVRRDEFSARGAAEPFDDWIRQQILASLEDPIIRNELKKLVQDDAPMFEPNVVDAQELTPIIERALSTALGESNLADEHRKELLEVLANKGFLESLANKIEDELRSSTDAPANYEKNNGDDHKDSEQ
jgi:hypothetical protein